MCFPCFRIRVTLTTFGAHTPGWCVSSFRRRGLRPSVIVCPLLTLTADPEPETLPPPPSTAALSSRAGFRKVHVVFFFFLFKPDQERRFSFDSAHVSEDAELNKTATRVFWWLFDQRSPLPLFLPLRVFIIYFKFC